MSQTEIENSINNINVILDKMDEQILYLSKLLNCKFINLKKSVMKYDKLGCNMFINNMKQKQKM